MRKHVNKLLIILFIALPITAYGASYTLNSASYPVNVNGQKLAVEPLNLNGTTYLPLKAISEAVGAPIEWDSANKSVEINTVDVEKLKESCVMIYSADKEKGTQGSGVYIDYDKILTANHVIEGAIAIKTSNEVFLKLEDSNSEIDAAVLKAPQEVKPIKIGDSDEVNVGDTVIIISSPSGKYNTVTFSKIYENTAKDELLMSSEGLSGGASGGAVFNTNGELIGIAYGIADKWCFATPINLIRKAL